VIQKPLPKKTRNTTESLNGTLANTGGAEKRENLKSLEKKGRKLTKLYLILKMCSTRVEISLGITF
jgi:hypothetical protein